MSPGATQHRDLIGFELIFFPTASANGFAIHKVFLHPSALLREKIFYSKLLCTPKGDVFLIDKIAKHGKADACRALMAQYS